MKIINSPLCSGPNNHKGQLTVLLLLKWCQALPGFRNSTIRLLRTVQTYYQCLFEIIYIIDCV